MNAATLTRPVCDADGIAVAFHQAERLTSDGVAVLLLCEHHVHAHRGALEAAGFIVGPIPAPIPAPVVYQPAAPGYVSWDRGQFI